MRFTKFLSFLLILSLLGCEFADDSSTSSQSVGGNAGQGGSMSRYAIQGSYLYVVDAVSLKVFNITNDQFTLISTQEVGSGIETIFSRPDYLYLGANNGMYIYSLQNPESPEFNFRYEHIVACDPVVVQGN